MSCESNSFRELQVSQATREIPPKEAGGNDVRRVRAQDRDFRLIPATDRNGSTKCDD